MASLLLGSKTAPAHNFGLGAKKQFGWLLTEVSAGTPAGGISAFWTGASVAATGYHLAIFQGSATKPEGKPLCTCTFAEKLAANTEHAITWTGTVPSPGTQHLWFVIVATGGTGSVLIGEEGGARVKGTETVEEPKEETAAHWVVEAANTGPVGFYMTGTPSPTASPELSYGWKLEAPARVKKASPELSYGFTLTSEAFTGGVAVYYGPEAEAAAEKKKWEEQEAEAGNTATTGVRYLRAWRAVTKRKTVLFLHGGGDLNNQWRTMEGVGIGSGQYVQAMAPKGAEHSGKAGHGFCVLNINYRDAPSVGAERQLADVVEGIKFAIAHAAEYNGDPTQVYIIAGSAGVGLALRASQIINAETPNAVQGIAGMSMYGADPVKTLEEMEAGSYREYPRTLSFKEKGASNTILESATPHGLITNSQIIFTSLPNEASNLHPNVKYYVKVVSATEIELSKKENGGEGLTWGGYGGAALPAAEKHPGGNVENLITDVQTAYGQELNYEPVGAPFTPAWSPPLVGSAEKTNSVASRTLQKYLGPLYHAMPGSFRMLLLKCERDLIEEDWINPTLTRLEREGHAISNRIITEGGGQEGHSFASLWGSGDIPGAANKGITGQEVIAAWIEASEFSPILSFGSRLSSSASRTFSPTVKFGTKLTSSASRTVTPALRFGVTLASSASRTVSPQLKFGAKLTSSASRTVTPSLQFGSKLASSASRTASPTLQYGTVLHTSAHSAIVPRLAFGTRLTASATRTAYPVLLTGTRLEARVARTRSVRRGLVNPRPVAGDVTSTS